MKEEQEKGNPARVKPAAKPGTAAMSAADVQLAAREKAIKELIKKERENKVTVLVVDDYPQARQMYENFLTSKGYHVIPAASAEEALLSLAAATIHLAVLDYNLPDTDGVTLLRKIRETHATLPVIMITANDKEEVIRSAASHGICSYLLKPVKFDLFMERVQQALQAAPSQTQEPPPLA